MELRQLECFRAVARLGSITAAASALHLSQPAVTKNIHSLEQELGLVLFDRHGRRIVLNASGQQLLPLIEQLLQQRDTLLSEAARCAQQRTIRLSVRAGSAFVPQIVRSFHETHPHCSISILSSAAEQADLYIDASVEERSDAETISIMEERIVLAVPSAHPLAARRELPLSELAEQPFISLRDGQAMRSAEDHYCALAGFTPQRTVECDAPATLRALIAQGAGIAFTAEKTWFPYPLQGVQLIPLIRPSCRRYLTLRVPLSRQSNPDVMLLRDDIIRFFQEL